MFRSVIYGLILILFSAFASAQEAEKAVSIEDLLKTIDGVNKSTESEVPCPKKAEVSRVAVAAKEAAPEFQKLEALSGEELSISVISEERANELFKRLKQEQLGLKNRAVCAQRAQVMSFVLEQEGISSGKLFVEPRWFGRIVPNYADNEKGNTEWKFHVAPFVYVRKGDKVEQYVFDPGAFDKPVPRSQWEAFLKDHPSSSYSRTAVASRYSYRLRDIYDSQSGYKSSELVQSRQILEVANSSKFNPANY